MQDMSALPSFVMVLYANLIRRFAYEEKRRKKTRGSDCEIPDLAIVKFCRRVGISLGIQKVPTASGDGDLVDIGVRVEDV
jgi:hypothetical protein